MKPKFLQIAAVLVVDALILSPAQALLHTWVARHLWTWFVASQYGTGPTFRAWVGIFMVVSLVTVAARVETALLHRDVAEDAIEAQGLWYRMWKAKSVNSMLTLGALLEGGVLYMLFWAR